MIKEYSYQFEHSLKHYQASELNKKIWYLSEGLTNYSLIYENDLCIGISFSIEDDKYKDFLKYLNVILKNDIYDLRNIMPKPLWKNPIKHHICEESTMCELLEAKLVHVHGEGQVSIKYPLTELFEFFDAILKNISVNKFNAEQFIFPTLIKSTVLDSAGYFDSFPNLWSFVSRLHNDFSTFTSFKKEDDKLNPSSIKTKACVTEYSLPPTMCYYIYDMYRDNALGNNTITTRGKSFRYENKYCKNMSRLWDFTIRETVFLGSKAYVNDCLDRYRILATKLMDLLGLSGKCIYASDPFYLTNNAAARINVQKMNHSKIELRLDISDSEDLAIASFNRHNQFISKHFNLRSVEQEGYIYSGCIGFGLERFLFAFLCQFGIDDQKWPSIIKDNYKKPNKDNIVLNIISEYLR